METGSVSANELATLSLIGGRGIGVGAGSGYGYGGTFADASSNAVRINASERSNDKGQDFISQQISDQADRNRDLAALASSHQNFNRIDDKASTIALASATAHQEIIREMNANAREAAKCCCEAKLQAAENQAKTDAALAEIKANQVADVRVADAIANATQNAKLDVLLAAGRGPGNS